MNSSNQNDESLSDPNCGPCSGLHRSTQHAAMVEVHPPPRFDCPINRLVARIGAIHDECQAMALLDEAVKAFGCDAAVFATFIRDDATMRSCRYLLAGGPRLGQLYASIQRTDDDPWLQYAGQHFEPCRAAELKVHPMATSQQAFLARAAEIGFRSALIVPTHSAQGPSRIGMLCLGSDRHGFFDSDALPLLTVPAVALSFHLHVWWHARLRRDLISRVNLSTTELDLARMQLAGLPTKVIADRLGSRVSTIDSRFHRLCRRLEVTNRRAAAELLRAYGVI